MTYNAAERRHVKEKARQSRLDQRDENQFIQAIMDLQQGRAWMLRTLTLCHIFETTYNGNALAGAFREGERNIGLVLLNSVMQASPDQYVQMMKEGNERERSANARHERLDDELHDGAVNHHGHRHPDDGNESGTVVAQPED